MQNKNEFNGYGLFNDVEDESLRAHNRSQMLKNIMEDHLDEEGKPTMRCASLTMTYFSLIPEAERKSVYDNLESYFAGKKAE